MIPSGPDGLYGYERHYDFDLEIELSCYWPDYMWLWDEPMGSGMTHRIYKDVLDERGFEELAKIRQQLVRIWNLARSDMELLQDSLRSVASESEGEIEELEETVFRNAATRASIKVTDENRDKIQTIIMYNDVLDKVTRAIPYRINIIDDMLTRYSVYGLEYRGSYQPGKDGQPSNNSEERIAWKGSAEQLEAFGELLVKEGLIRLPNETDTLELLTQHFHLSDEHLSDGEATERSENSTLKPIWWLETNTLLLHLFDLLLSKDLIDTDILHRQSACIAEHFVDKNGKELDNERLNKSRYQMNTPQRANRVEKVIKAVVET